jgi:hypothetical protein
MLRSVYDVPLAERKTTPLAALMGVAAGNAAKGGAMIAPRPVEAAATPTRRRNQIWELSAHLHCSIIGTCMTAPELRRLLIKLKVGGAEAAGDHDMHMLGVLLAGRAKEGAKHLQKALDRRHRAPLSRFAKARDAQALCDLWEEAMNGGDIPGAYWALLTHPLATDHMVRHAFGDVHMLSHLVGATNRADLARLRQLEAENAALADKIERQQRQLRDGFLARDTTIRALRETLTRPPAREADGENASGERGDEIVALKQTIATLGGRLARDSERRDALERRLAALNTTLDETRQGQRAAVAERDALQHEAAALEAEIAALLSGGAHAADIDLAGVTLLYVGGRANQVPQLRALVERSRGRLLHHDGGLEHSAALLPGLISRADIALFPVDCVSHDAVAAVKRLCRQAGKPFQALRTSSLAGLLSALADLRVDPALAPQAIEA